ncbi:MAG: multidrug effflux MFS transporter [Burkholderiales bacterium]|nr:multidrug effflux MFS transporter [Burkholderiales bacterium]
MKLPPSSAGFVAILMVMIALLPLSTDLYLASLPALSRYFNSSISRVQLTLSVFVAGFALSQLVLGPLSDRYGRRPVVLACCGIYVAAGLACMLADSMATLLAARFFQAIGACGGTVVGRAIVRDTYGAGGTARMLGYIHAGVALAPILGPTLGGSLETWFGWRANFALLAGIGSALLAAAWLLLAETNLQRDPRATDAGPMLANYRKLLGDRRFVGYVLCLSCGYAGIFAFLSGASFIMIPVLGLSPQRFGVFYGITVLGYIIGTMSAGRLSLKFGVDRMLKYGTPLALASGSAMLALALAGVQNLAALLVPMFFYLIAAGINLPNAMAGAIGPFPKMAGMASALMGFIQMSLGAGVGYAVGKLHDGSTVPMSAAIAAAGWGVFLVYWGLVRGYGSGRNTTQA